MDSVYSGLAEAGSAVSDIRAVEREMERMREGFEARLAQLELRVHHLELRVTQAEVEIRALR
jgi:hypothetical protein